MPDDKSEPNVKQAVPFFMVSNLEFSLRFYVDGLGFTRTKSWIDEGKLRWCWLELGGAALMLQEFHEGERPWSSKGRPGEGVSICFQCNDALAIFHGAMERGLRPQRPFVGNAMWVTILADPDGYKLDFESPTNVAEETLYGADIPTG
jgi:lactoylglutathione lyase